MEAEFKQLSLIESAPDLRPPETVTWNLWHGCTNYVVLNIIRIMCFFSYVEQAEERSEY